MAQGPGMKLMHWDELILGIKASQYDMAVDRLRPRRLPDEIGRHGVGAAIYGVGQSKRASERAIVIIAHPCSGGEQQGQGRCAEAEQRSRLRPILSNPQPVPQCHCYRQAKKKAFVGTSGSQQYDSES